MTGYNFQSCRVILLLTPENLAKSQKLFRYASCLKTTAFQGEFRKRARPEASANC
jgi:hypothetical protein